MVHKQHGLQMEMHQNFNYSFFSFSLTTVGKLLNCPELQLLISKRGE